MCEFGFVHETIPGKASSRDVSQSKISHGWHEVRVKSVEIFGHEMDKSHPLKKSSTSVSVQFHSRLW
jgi:hypothetical protein